jgi:hypothetical protein
MFWVFERFLGVAFMQGALSVIRSICTVWGKAKPAHYRAGSMICSEVNGVRAVWVLGLCARVCAKTLFLHETYVLNTLTLTKPLPIRELPRL